MARDVFFLTGIQRKHLSSCIFLVPARVKSEQLTFRIKVRLVINVPSRSVVVLSPVLVDS